MLATTVTSTVKILYFITSLDYGGTQKNLLELARFAKSKGHDVAVVSVKKGGIYEKKFSESLIPVFSLDLPNFSFAYLLKLPFAFVRLINLIGDNNSELLHSFLFQANIIGRLAAKVCGIKNISSVRVMEIEKKFQWFISKLTTSLVDAFTVNSKDLIEFLRAKEGVEPAKISYIPNYINLSEIPSHPSDVRKELKLNKNDFLILSIGRLEKQKGYEYLIEAVGIIREEIPNMKLLIVGDGSLRERIEFKISKMKLVDKVFLTPPAENVYDIIKASDLFVLPSLWEGSPNVLIEALACEIPAISTDVSGVREILNENYIIKPGDAVEIAEKILYVYRNFPQAKEDAIKNKKNLNKFTSQENLEEYLNLYKNILKRNITQ